MERLRHLLITACPFILLLSLIRLEQATVAQSFDLPLAPQGEEPCLPSEIDSIYPEIKSITVRVMNGQTWGSGFLVEKQESSYTIVTNDHVIRFGNPNRYQVVMPDSAVYDAQPVRSHRFSGYDLALLKIESERQYSTASFSVFPQVNEAVFAAGFPLEPSPNCKGGFRVTRGEVMMLSERSFNGGYQLGYTNQILNGMSGGPVVNDRGEVVAINGMHAYPVWGNPYVYADGSMASGSLQEQFSQWSWGIPIQTFLELNQP